jgi:CBS domain-containing protein
VVVRIARRQLFVPIASIPDLQPGRVQFVGDTVNLKRFERRPGEVLLSKDLRARHLINLQGALLIRANEIELARVDGRWEVVAVDPSPRTALRHLLPRAIGKRIPAGKVVDWASIEPFVAHVPTARLRIPYRKLARLHPAQIADLVEAASHEEGEEIIEAVGQDRELEADVFEELDAEHQIEFFRSRTDAEAALLLATMAPDDAADLITELDQEHRLPVLQLLPLAQQRKVRALLSYNPETAGGLMSPDFLWLPESTPVSEALNAVRTSKAPPEAVAVVFARGDDDSVTGSVSVVRLVQAPPEAMLGSVVRPNPAHVHPDWDLHAVTRKMTDFNLTVAPVMDEQHRMVGVITVDDVLEMLLPSGWRRDFGMTSVEE